jgi:hypothetical protein
MTMNGRPKEHNIGLQKYNQKLQNLGFTGNRLGGKYKFPTFIGCSEIENRGVLEFNQRIKIVNKEYGIIHFDSPTKEESTLRYCIKYFRPTYQYPANRYRKSR